MAKEFNRFRKGFQLVKVDFTWNVHVQLLPTKTPFQRLFESTYFSSKENPASYWKLRLMNLKQKLSIDVLHYDSAGREVEFYDPVQVKVSIVNGKGCKIHQQILSSCPTSSGLSLTRDEIIQSGCQQDDGSLIIYCKILSHVRLGFISDDNLSDEVINYSDELSSELEGLFDEMHYSDVIFNVRGREFPAHRAILAARSEIFAMMFQERTEEKLTNQIEIEDIEPEVFQQLLRFIYTGRLSRKTLETMAQGLIIAADKYLLEGLKTKWEYYLLCYISPVNYVLLLLHGDLQNPKEPMKEAAKYFRRFPLEVMATDQWIKAKQENPTWLIEIHEFVYRHKKFLCI